MVGISRKFFSVEPGVEVTSDGRRYVAKQVMTRHSVLAKELGTGESRSLRIETLSRIVEPTESDQVAERDLALYSEEEWA